MKRITLTLAVAGAVVVPMALLTGSAWAANPHGDKSDPNAGCNGQGQGAACSNPGLPQSQGCLNGQAPVQNPHCQPGASTIAPVTPVSNPGTGNSPGSGGGGGNGPADKPARGVAGAKAGGQAPGDPGTAAAVSGKTIDQLPFTGLETLWLALVGAGMLTLGLVLWVRTSPRKESASDTEPPADDGGEAADWDVPELGIAPAVGRREVHLPFSEFESLGRLLMRKGKARLRAGPLDAFVVVLDSD